jgi:hypothetical protein
VAELTGVANVLRGSVAGRDSDRARIDVGGLSLVCPAPWTRTGDTVDVAIRAERVVLRRGETASSAVPNMFPAEIVDESAFGPAHLLRLRIGGTDVQVEAELAARPYEVLGVAGRRNWFIELPVEDLHVMPT